RVTHNQEEKLEARIRALGEEPSGGKGMVNQLLGRLGDLIHGAHDEYDKTTQNLIKAFAVENFEIAMYESLAQFAQAIGDAETASLAHSIQQQEQAAAQKVWALIPSCATRAASAIPQARAA